MDEIRICEYKINSFGVKMKEVCLHHKSVTAAYGIRHNYMYKWDENGKAYIMALPYDYCDEKYEEIKNKPGWKRFPYYDFLKERR